MVFEENGSAKRNVYIGLISVYMMRLLRLVLLTELLISVYMRFKCC